MTNLGYRIACCILWILAKLLLSEKELNVFDPITEEKLELNKGEKEEEKEEEKEGENEEENEEENEDGKEEDAKEEKGIPRKYPDILPNVTAARLMGSFRAWLAFQVSCLRNKDITELEPRSQVSEVRHYDLILRKGSSSSYARSYGENGFINGKLEFFITEKSGSVFLENLNEDGRSRSIEELKVTVVKVGKEEHLYQDIFQRALATDPHLGYQLQSQDVFKVTVDENGAIPVFHLTPPLDEEPILQVYGSEEESDEVRSSRLGRRIVGSLLLKPLEYGKPFYPENLVVLFRRKSRKSKIIFPFRAAIWLNARPEDVPAPLHSFFLILFFILGSVVPVCIFAIPPFQDWWDRIERVMYLSAYFLTAISVRELLATKGSAATNVLRGFIQPGTLTQMAQALRISVPQLLLLARLGGTWTEQLDYTQLCFLGRRRPGIVKRDHWDKMNNYAVKLEAFNKQFALLEYGISRITRVSGQEGGHIQWSTREGEMEIAARDFREFDETKHYLAGKM